MNDGNANSHAFAREQARVNREEFIFYLLSVAVFLFSLLVYTYPSVEIVHLVYREQRVTAEERRLKAEMNMLRLKYEMMMSPDEMDRRAASAGFAPPSPGQVVFVSKK